MPNVRTLLAGRRAFGEVLVTCSLGFALVEPSNVAKYANCIGEGRFLAPSKHYNRSSAYLLYEQQPTLAGPGGGNVCSECPKADVGRPAD